LWSLVILLCALVVGPMVLFGTGVATTLARRLVPFHGDEASRALLVAAVVSVAVVFVLTRSGLPTSLTLSLIGAIIGAGVGSGLPVRADVLVKIVIFGVTAPVAAAALAYYGSRLLRRGLHGAHVTTWLRRMHVMAYSLQCLSYSANDGQKMFAMFALVEGAASTGAVRDPWWLALSVSALFALGVALSVRKITANVGSGLLSVQLRHAVVAETCTFALVMGSGLAGVPATTTQSLAGGLVGAGLSEDRSRVRWSMVSRLAGAWAVTLPASVAVAALASAIWRAS